MEAYCTKMGGMRVSKKKKMLIFLETNVNGAFVAVYILSHMSSPRTRDFYKQLAGSIRAGRALQEQKREAAAAELRALEGRLHRLCMWEEIWKELERLQRWEEACTQGVSCSTL